MGNVFVTHDIKQQNCLHDSAGGAGIPPKHSRQTTLLRWLGLFVFAVYLVHVIGLRADENQKRFYTLVAAMITKIPDYTKWPEPIDKDHPGIAKLAIMTDDHKIFDFFNEAMDKRKVGDVTWKADRIDSLNEAIGYRFLYIESGSDLLPKNWHEQFKEKGILTFGKSDMGNCIFTYTIADSRLQFDLDLAAAKQAGVGFDPRLIKLARKVESGSSEP